MDITQKILLFITADLPLVFPFIFVGVFWGVNQKAYRESHKVLIMSAFTISAFAFMVLLQLLCDSMFGVNNPVFQSPIRSLVVCMGIVSISLLWCKKKRYFGRKLIRNVFSVVAMFMIYQAVYPLARYSWFVHHLHID